MIVGFKTGPRTWQEGQQIVEQEGARMCEVWFDAGRALEYEDMFSWLAKRGVQVGLHHWGVCEGSLKTNIATNHSAVREEALQQIRETIDIGRQIDCVYINVHPGAQYLERIDLESGEQALTNDPPTSPEESEALLLAAAQELAEYAGSQGVLLTIETMPAIEAHNYTQRRGRYDPGNATTTAIKKVAQVSYIANDITHTAAALAHELKTDDRDTLWRELLSFTKTVAEQTRLVHINTVVEPFDGTDSHNGLLAEDYAAGAFPALDQVRELLAVLGGQENVFLIPEPKSNMPANYRVLVELVA